MTLPPVPAPFYWTDAPWGAALRCRALDPLAPHLFTTRQLALSSPEDLRHVAAVLGAQVAVTLDQVHGRDVAIVRRDRAETQERPRADVVVSDWPGAALLVRAADCAPILMADRKTGAVAAVHAGWRGTAASASVAALDALRAEFGSRPEDIVAALGPTIGPCCYEVGTELVDAFAKAGHARHLVDRWFMAPPPARGSHERQTLRLDVAGANRDLLILAGVPEDQVHVVGLCTAMHLDVLTSFRAEKDGAGRIAGVIRAAGDAS